MFIGHYAVGFAAKRLAPGTSLGVLMAAVTLADLLWPFFVLIGLEQAAIEPGNTRFTPLNFLAFPISHGLVALVGFATLFATIHYLITKYWRGTVVVWLCVLSHWVLDVITHRPDLPLYTGGPRFGFGLWNHMRATIIVEGLLYLAGVWVYLRTTRAKDRVGEWGLFGYVLWMAMLYVSIILLPQLPTLRGVAFSGIGIGWVFVLGAWWIDRHRTTAEVTKSSGRRARA